jgi:Zn-dependent protease with chaperone function
MSALVVAVVAAVAFGAATALAVAAGYARLRPWIMGLPARLRAQIVFALLAAPVVAGVALAVLALFPGVLGQAFPALDHCPHHDDDHFHLCFVHAPSIANQWLTWSLVVAALLPASLGLARTIPRVLRARRVIRLLRHGVHPKSAGQHEIVASEAPFAITAGLFEPRVYVTSRLLRDLDPSSRRAMLEHEAAHVRRRDPLRKLAGELASALHLPGTRRALLEDLSLACEEACDEDAAAAISDRAGVAAALVALGRLMESSSAQRSLMVAGFGDGNIGARVHALLASPKLKPRLPSLRVVLVTSVVVAAVLAAPFHHVVETVLSTLLGS